MTDKPEHLSLTVTDRGFDHMPPIDTWSGYEFPVGRFLDFTVVQPRRSGEIEVYESSDAVIPSIWLRTKAEVVVGTEVQEVDVAAMVTVDNARKLGEQLIALADNHYQAEGS